ncbi:MAG: precorrin-3B C(17)-methyltransferase [Halanaerobiaceae bacterium]
MGKNNKLFIVGIGPGNPLQMSRLAYHVIGQVDVIVGYKTYIYLIKEIISKKQEVYLSGMRQERERAAKAINYVSQGKNAAIISSGDPGVYGMAGLVLELIDQQDDKIEVEVIAGITAANAAAAILGAPLMHDYTVISLSDLLTPWPLIEKRLEKSAEGDFITVLYNPSSTRRKEQIKIAWKILMEYRLVDTPVGIVRQAGREGQEKTLTTLAEMLEEEIDMLTTVVIGNSQTYISKNKMITPRGYKL